MNKILTLIVLLFVGCSGAAQIEPVPTVDTLARQMENERQVLDDFGQELISRELAVQALTVIYDGDVEYAESLVRYDEIERLGEDIDSAQEKAIEVLAAECVERILERNGLPPLDAFPKELHVACVDYLYYYDAVERKYVR